MANCERHHQRVIPHECIGKFDNHSLWENHKCFDMFWPWHTSLWHICLVINQHNWQTGDFWPTVSFTPVRWSNWSVGNPLIFVSYSKLNHFLEEMPEIATGRSGLKIWKLKFRDFPKKMNLHSYVDLLEANHKITKSGEIEDHYGLLVIRLSATRRYSNVLLFAWWLNNLQ